MRDTDQGMGSENMENTIPESGLYGDGLFRKEHHDGDNLAEEGGERDESQPSEAETEKPKRRRKSNLQGSSIFHATNLSRLNFNK